MLIFNKPTRVALMCLTSIVASMALPFIFESFYRDYTGLYILNLVMIVFPIFILILMGALSPIYFIINAQHHDAQNIEKTSGSASVVLTKMTAKSDNAQIDELITLINEKSHTLVENPHLSQASLRLVESAQNDYAPHILETYCDTQLDLRHREVPPSLSSMHDLAVEQLGLIYQSLCEMERNTAFNHQPVLDTLAPVNQNQSDQVLHTTREASELDSEHAAQKYHHTRV